MVSLGLIVPDANPPEADSRRIPYRITKSGCREFDEWLLKPGPPDAGLGNWLIFADMLLPEHRLRLLDEMREQLWLENKTVATARERVLSRGRRLLVRAYRPSAFLMLRRIKQIAAELEFLQELRQELEELAPSCTDLAARSVDDASTSVEIDAADREPRAACAIREHSAVHQRERDRGAVLRRASGRQPPVR
jgi:hypothetical protein